MNAAKTSKRPASASGPSARRKPWACRLKVSNRCATTRAQSGTWSMVTSEWAAAASQAPPTNQRRMRTRYALVTDGLRGDLGQRFEARFSLGGCHDLHVHVLGVKEREHIGRRHTISHVAPEMNRLSPTEGLAGLEQVATLPGFEGPNAHTAQAATREAAIISRKVSVWLKSGSDGEAPKS